MARHYVPREWDWNQRSTGMARGGGGSRRAASAQQACSRRAAGAQLRRRSRCAAAACRCCSAPARPPCSLFGFSHRVEVGIRMPVARTRTVQPCVSCTLTRTRTRHGTRVARAPENRSTQRTADCATHRTQADKRSRRSGRSGRKVSIHVSPTHAMSETAKANAVLPRTAASQYGFTRLSGLGCVLEGIGNRCAVRVRSRRASSHCTSTRGQTTTASGLSQRSEYQRWPARTRHPQRPRS